MQRRLPWRRLALSSAALTILFTAPPAAAKGGASWTPRKVQQTISAGSVTTMTVVLAAKGALPPLDLRVVPELAPYVSIAPAQLPAVPAGEGHTLLLRFAVPPNAPIGSLEGVVQARQTERPARNFGNLAVELTIEPLILPHDPGDEGEATLAGIDSDGDGVRDDIQRWIALEYWEEPLVQEGLRQTAVSLQHALSIAGDIALSRTARNEVDRARNCLSHVTEHSSAAEARQLLTSELLNTDQRSHAYIQYNADLSGGAYPAHPPSPETCDFLPGSLTAASRTAASQIIDVQAQIFFLNGICTDESGARESADLLRRSLAEENRFGSLFPVHYLYNVSRGCMLDFHEAVTQAVGEGGLGLENRIFWRIVFGLPIAAGIPLELNEIIESIVTNPLHITTVNLSENLATVVAVLQNVPVLLVPHSQGNFFANSIYEAVPACLQSSIGIVSVATPTSNVGGGGPHWTSTNDFIWRLPGALPPNTVSGTCLLSAWDCHSFGNYLESGARSREDILGSTFGALAELPKAQDCRRTVFADDFDDNFIDPSKWLYDGFAVTETLGEFHVDVTRTDRGGWADTVLLNFDPTRRVVLQRKANVYAANRFFDGDLTFRWNGDPGHPQNFGLSYANYYYTGGDECITVGFAAFRNAANPHVCKYQGVDVTDRIPPLWNTWYDEQIVYDPTTGELTYSIDSTPRIQYNVGPSPPGVSSFSIHFGAWGWWTGHRHWMDDIEIRQD